MEEVNPQDPPGFVVTTELEKAAFECGYRIPQGIAVGWFKFCSTTARGTIWLAGASEHGPWLLAISHTGAASELSFSRTETSRPDAAATFRISSLAELYAAVARVYQLSVSLPNAPFKEFEAETSALPRSTEAERIVIARIGQDVFRRALLEYWNGRCPLTGISDQALLRASHIIAWADCYSDAMRLNVHNGLLLSTLWDSAFDAGLVSFDNEGYAIASSGLSEDAQAALNMSDRPRLPSVCVDLRKNLRCHRRQHGFQE